MTTTTVHYFTSNKSLPAAVVVTVTVIIFNGVPSFIIMFTRERNAQRNKLSQQEQKGHVLYKKPRICYKTVQAKMDVKFDVDIL